MGICQLLQSSSSCRRLLALVTIAGLLVSCSEDAKKKTVLTTDGAGEELLEAVDPNPEPEALEEVIVVAESEEASPFDESPVVSFLGYHDFTLSRNPTEMLIREDKFREQMQMLKDSDISVISMEDYLAWRRREMPLPKRCVVITADDGWREVHTYMMPIMKEFGYPFTVFIYTNFLDSGGRTLTQAQVEEIIGAGGTIGSHSVSHRDMNRVKFGNQSITFGQFERLRTAYSKGLEELDGGASTVTVEGRRHSRAAVEAKLGEFAKALIEYDAWILD
ncbi:MAG: polysaccharide deacetylase family protein, partial [Verrucomicrobiales bacterium]